MPSLRRSRACERPRFAPTPPHALARLRVAAPFLIVALIWGSTWYVITGQISAGAAELVDRLPLRDGHSGDVRAGADHAQIAADCRARGICSRWRSVLFQFGGNFNFVYRAEMHLTSGIVAVMFALLMVPNALFGRWLLGPADHRRASPPGARWRSRG